MKQLFTLVCLCGFLAAIVGSADAQEKPDKKAPDKKAQFAKIDKDSDGKVTKAEFLAAVKKDDAENKAKREKAFTRLDTDKNGSLTLEEFSAPPKKKKPE